MAISSSSCLSNVLIYLPPPHMRVINILCKTFFCSKRECDWWLGLFMIPDNLLVNFLVFAHLHGADACASPTPWPCLSQAPHTLEDPVHAALHACVFSLQILRLLLQVSDCPPLSVPPARRCLQDLPHLERNTFKSAKPPRKMQSYGLKI